MNDYFLINELILCEKKLELIAICFFKKNENFALKMVDENVEKKLSFL